LHDLLAAGFVERLAPGPEWGHGLSLVLTPAGAARAWAQVGGAPEQPAEGESQHRPRSKPRWDPRRRELWYRGQLVKRIHRTAANQECILNSLQELGWPPRMDDPLPGGKGGRAEERLRDAVKSLNRHRVCPLIRFEVEAGGRGLRWTEA
jgi:hypothetical protein